MYKKGIATLAFLVLVASTCYAQVARNASNATASGFGVVTNFTNISVQGLDRAGNPGFIEFVGGITGLGDQGTTSYFLWVDKGGKLRLASDSDFVDIKSDSATRYGSFPSGTWEFLNPGTIVGTQS